MHPHPTKKGESSFKSNIENSTIQVTESVIDITFETIENSLDIFPLVKELNKMRILFSYFMANHRSPAWQIYYINRYISESKGEFQDDRIISESDVCKNIKDKTIPDESKTFNHSSLKTKHLFGQSSLAPNIPDKNPNVLTQINPR